MDLTHTNAGNNNSYGTNQWSFRTQAMKSRRSRPSDSFIAILMPWVLFAVVTYAFLYLDPNTWIIWVIAGCSALSAVFFITLGFTEKHKIFFALGFICLAAVVVGVLVGGHLNTSYLSYHSQLQNGVTFTNVDPTVDLEITDGAAAYDFVGGAFVDDRRTMGYVSPEGTVHCVAPVVLQGKHSNSIWYWATGTNCCEPRGNFFCGTSRKSVLTQAIPQQHPQKYSDSIAQAISVYKLTPVAGAHVISFVDSPSEVIADICTDKLHAWIVALSVYLGVSVFLGLLTMKFLPTPASRSHL